MLTRLTLVVTHHCNLRCLYCYAHGGDYGHPIDDMTPSMGVDILEYFAFKFDGIKEVFFFGGEPLLALDTIKTVCDHAELLVKKGLMQVRPKFSLSTNGTLLSEELIALVKKYDIGITISIDGPPDIHDKNRRSRGNHGTAIAVLNVIRRLRTNSIPFATECTYTVDHWNKGYTPLSIYKYLRQLGASNIAITEVMQKGCYSPLREEPLSEQFYSATLDLAHYVSEEFAETGGIYLSELSRCYDSLVNKPEMLKHYFCGAGVDVFAVNPSGQTYPCHLFNSIEEFALGHYQHVDLEVERMPRKQEYTCCIECPILTYCRACPARMYLTSDDGIVSPRLEDCRYKIDFMAIAADSLYRFAKRI